jgi:hypothetical protein
MMLPEEAQKSLTAVVAEGGAACAAKLGEITHHDWSVNGVTLSLDEAGPFADLLASVAVDHYGAHLTFPGGSFLVLCSGKSGYLIATAFTRDVQDRVESLHKREAHALGEVSNIVLNPMVGILAKAWGARLIISAPKSGLASQRDHLANALARYKEGNPLAASFFVKLGSRGLFSECVLLLFLDRDFVSKIAAK